MCLTEKLKNISRKFQDNRILVSLAESCTGGLIAKTLTDIPGSSEWFQFSLVTYSNSSKIKYLNVKEATLSKFGAVSKEIAEEMSLGAQISADNCLSISITGIAGPGGGSKQKPIGTIFLCFTYNKKIIKHFQLSLKGERSEIRQQILIFIINELDKLTLKQQV
jgi:nicotinamide-nucleotide amidase